MDSVAIPTSTVIDRPALFDIGWGMGGVCTAPTVAKLFRIHDVQGHWRQGTDGPLQPVARLYRANPPLACPS